MCDKAPRRFSDKSDTNFSVKYPSDIVVLYLIHQIDSLIDSHKYVD